MRQFETMRMIQKITKHLILVFMICLLFQNCRLESKWNCFGASTPVDLEIKNTFGKNIKVGFYEYSEKKEFKKIGKVSLKIDEQKTLCFENEGSITNGLYIFSNGLAFKIKLSTSSDNRFDFIDLASQIEVDSEIIEIVNKYD